MDSHVNHKIKTHSTSRLKLIFFSSLVVAVIAISFSLTSTQINHFKTLLLKLTFSSRHNFFFPRLLGFPFPSSQTLTPTPISISPYCVLWMAPFLSGGGYSSEAWSYILSLHHHMKNPRFKLGIEQHGDLESIEFWEGLSQGFRNLAIELHNTECRMNETIVVCHSEPGAWYPPLYQTLSSPPTGHGEFMHTIGRTMFETDRNNTECRMNETIVAPPTGHGEFMHTIGRTMFETDRLNSDHVSRCNQMDFVWVPTEFHVSTFVESGVDPSKVVKIVQPVDVSFFDPLKYKPYDLASIGELVLGRMNARSNSREEFVFLSVFKWEYRKGWDVLLRAYLKEFSSTDGVSLYLLTNPYHSDGDFGNKIMEFVEGSGIEKPATGWSPIYVMDTHIAQVDLPRVYAAADAFVLPSRGEGWGRPLVEAMAMSLPVIATNWSGPTEYLTDENSYPLPVERMSEVKEGAFRGHMWAEPGVDQLGGLMRYVVSNPEEARGKGRKAREDMISRFSPEIVAGIVTDHLQHILGNK